VSGERKEIMKILSVEANQQAKRFGIDIVDVRIKRIDLAQEISESVYRRMEAERLRVAKDLRARGAETAEKIRAEADRERTVILAEAYSEAERVRGEGDATATGIYAQAFSQDAEFYSLYRTLSAYEKTFANKDDILVLEPDSEFFKYFK
jgi:membrane protease subunit HflC